MVTFDWDVHRTVCDCPDGPCGFSHFDSGPTIRSYLNMQLRIPVWLGRAIARLVVRPMEEVS